jgi:hypothetical protein
MFKRWYKEIQQAKGPWTADSFNAFSPISSQIVFSKKKLVVLCKFPLYSGYTAHGQT